MHALVGKQLQKIQRHSASVCAKQAEQLSRRAVTANIEVLMMLHVAPKRKRADELEVEELAAQFVAKIRQLIGTTATREFTCHGVLYRVPPAREFMDMTAADLRAQIALVELDLIAYRSTMTEGQA